MATGGKHQHCLQNMFSTMQAFFSVVIFVLLSSQDGFSTSTGPDGKKPALYNGIFSTIAFLVSFFLCRGNIGRGCRIDGECHPQQAAMPSNKEWMVFESGALVIWKPLIQ